MIKKTIKPISMITKNLIKIKEKYKMSLKIYKVNLSLLLSKNT